MGATRGFSARILLFEIIAIILALLFLVPFYFVLVNSIKSFADLLLNSAGLPKEIIWSNYTKVWTIIQYPKVFMNSLIVTVVANLGIAVFSSMAAYRLVRRPTRMNQIVFSLFVAAMVIPFQSIMIPLVKVANTVGLMNSLPGLIICYFGFGISLSTFLFHGFVKAIPLEIEEAAIVDGTTPFGVFWRIVFPLLKPMTVTVILLNSLWIWNDFLLPSLVIPDASLRTIPLATSAFFAQYTKQWDLALAGLVLGVMPIVVFFLFMQRHIIEGITAGSVKG
jgi:raffinose/stachyose/melibiose transport system permease protein